MKQMDLVGIRIEMPQNQPVVLLQERSGDRFLPIWVGANEASAIAFAQQGIVAVRPLTHDLFAGTLRALGKTLLEVLISDVSDGIFYANLVFADGVRVSARPSDAIALALRFDCDILCADDVLAESGVRTEEEDQDSEVQRFREFLDEVSAEDFEQ